MAFWLSAVEYEKYVKVMESGFSGDQVQRVLCHLFEEGWHKTRCVSEMRRSHSGGGDGRF
jgi:hypothetical protein